MIILATLYILAGILELKSFYSKYGKPTVIDVVILMTFGPIMSLLATIYNLIIIYKMTK